MILNSIFKDAVVVNSDEQFVNCTFESGTTAKEKGKFGLSINGNANVDVKGCEFKNKGYSAIYMNSTGKINIEDNKIDCTGLYNPIEGGSGANTALLDDVNIKNNYLEGICGNNYFNFYNLKDGAVINLEDNIVSGMSQNSEVVRLSNLANSNATFNISNMKYSYDLSTKFDETWTKFILLQDYTGNKGQDFSKFEINIENLECQAQKVEAEDKFPIGGLFVVYDNKANGGTAAVITDNNPVINLK